MNIFTMHVKSNKTPEEGKNTMSGHVERMRSEYNTGYKFIRIQGAMHIVNGFLPEKHETNSLPIRWTCIFNINYLNYAILQNIFDYNITEKVLKVGVKLIVK